ncbi:MULTISPECIES: hypothetical protein [unclassified Azospirillum]|uniref:hypothetical protein n=1 Tax=unclassified Azospirillum TaxID=2630922 RepID=UPI000B6B30C4|nr:MULTISPECIES: hypothetical protein [unclassified Azospirillum]SNR91608.1 hypothetical protein SAMN05880556_101506 [Azospirillum sp. RU38E]SNS07502.1 hypothetical protein SAMN05880591_101506 [Azospirillum sp. RU37A]
MTDLARLEAAIRADAGLFAQLSASAADKAALLAAIQAQSARLGLTVPAAEISARLDSLIDAAANDELSDAELELVAAGATSNVKGPSAVSGNVGKTRVPSVG